MKTDLKPVPDPVDQDYGRLTSVIQILSILGISTLIDLSSIHRWHHADSLVPVLISLHKWTFYYWEQNRYGMLTALLALPFQHPLTNLLIQNGVTTFAGLACFPLAARYFGADRQSRVIGYLAMGLFVLVVPPFFQWLFLSTYNVFAISMALGLSGLLIAEKTTWPGWCRILAGAFCFLIGSWVNSALGLLLLPLAALVPFTHWFTGDDPDRAKLQNDNTVRIASHPLVGKIVTGVGLCGFGAVSAMFLQRTTPYRTTWIVRPPVSDWPQLIETATTGCWDEVQPQLWFAVLGVMLLLGIAYHFLPKKRTMSRRCLWMVFVVAISALAYSSVMWILFQGRWRYVVPALVLLHVMICMTALRPLLMTISERGLRILHTLSIAFTLTAVLVVLGLPSLSTLENNLKTEYQNGVDDLIATRCTHVAGDYWKVWPAMMMVNWQYQDAKSSQHIWALSHRSEPTKQYWSQPSRDEIRVGCYINDPQAAEYRNQLGVPLKLAETRGVIEVWVADQ